MKLTEEHLQKLKESLPYGYLGKIAKMMNVEKQVVQRTLAGKALTNPKRFEIIECAISMAAENQERTSTKLKSFSERISAL
jgi:hypothetical protein